MSLSTVSNALNTFAINFFQQINLGIDNLFVSPYSIYSALLMTSMGASGTTYSELRNALHCNLISDNEEEVLEQFKNFSERIESMDESVKLFLGNSVWSKNLLPQYIQRLQTELKAESYPLTSKEEINRWVSEKTNGKITKIIETIPANTVSILVNSIYFKGSWQTVFKKTGTHEREFLTPSGSKSVKTMSVEATLPHIVSPDFTAVELFYAGKSYSMLIIMPTSLSLPEFIAQKLHVNLHNEILALVKSSKRILHLPKFTIEYGPKELRGELAKQGVERVYVEGEAELDRMSDDPTVRVDEILHKAICIVNEEGTEAAAVTAIRARTKAKKTTQIIAIDKPFVFLILEKNQNTILFCGAVSDPSKKN